VTEPKEDCPACGNELDDQGDCEDSTCEESPYYVEEDNPYNG